MLTQNGIHTDNTPSIYIWNSKDDKIFRIVYIWLYSTCQASLCLWKKICGRPLHNRVLAMTCYTGNARHTRMRVGLKITIKITIFPDSKVHGANMAPIWGRQDPGGPHVGPMNFAIWDTFFEDMYSFRQMKTVYFIKTPAWRTDNVFRVNIWMRLINWTNVKICRSLYSQRGGMSKNVTKEDILLSNIIPGTLINKTDVILLTRVIYLFHILLSQCGPQYERVTILSVVWVTYRWQSLETYKRKIKSGNMQRTTISDNDQ